MALIVISPYSRKLRNGGRNPKDYPYWDALVALLKKEKDYIIQIGQKGEKRVPAVDNFYDSISLEGVANLIDRADLWVAVDNFLQHHVRVECPEKRGVVIFSQSNPEIFGYNTNYNLYKDKKYFRDNQYLIWEQAEYIEDAFPPVEDVFAAIKEALHAKKTLHFS